MSEKPLIDQFVHTWKCPVATAEHYLKRHNWDYDNASEEYWRTHVLIY